MRSSPVPVLLVDHAPVAGGVEMMIRDLLTALDPARVAPTVITDPDSPMRGRFSRVYPEVALPLTRLKRNPAAGLSLISSAWQLARVARGAPGSVIQTFTARTHLIGALAGLLARRPVVWRLNDDTLPPRLARVFGRAPRRIIAVSEHLRRFYRGALTVSDIIPDGLPLPAPADSAAARARLLLPPDALVVALVARLVRWKGQPVFLRALAQLAQHHPNLRGLIVGGWSESEDVAGPLGGGEPYRQELLALRDELGLTETVVFTGHQDAPLPVFAAADIVAHTSVLPEPFGRVIVEAMAAGRPVVAARAGGAEEIVLDGVTGLLTPTGDVAALAAALGRLAADPALRARMGAAGRARAAQEYSLARMAERFTRVWEAVAA